jgi:hypothetical protein
VRRLGSPAWLLPALFAAGAAISAFTILRGIDPFDEGLMLQAAARVANGQWPYRDFLWSYGPGQVLLLAGSVKLFGTSLLWWRVVRVLVNAGVALTVFVLARSEAGTRWALAGWLVAACVIAQPTSANPFPVAVLLGLLAVLAGARGRPALAGVLVALAIFWRPDFGVYAAAAAGAALLLEARRPRPLAAFAASAAGIALLLFLPFAIKAGPGDLFDSLVTRSLRDGSYWRLPLPLDYGGRLRLWPPGPLAHDAKDALAFYMPLVAIVGLAAVALLAALRRRLPRPAVGGLLVLAAGYALYLLGRTDELHLAPLLVALAALVPLLAAGAEGRAARVAAVAAVACFALTLAYGAGNRISQLGSPEQLETLDVPAADGVEARPVDARALPRVVAVVQSRVPPGQPIYVAPLRSDLVRIGDPLLYVLAERPNPLDQDFGLQTSPAEQGRIVAGLTRARPKVVVRWLDPVSAQREPNRRGTPSGSHVLDDWLAQNYRPLERDGFYELLVPR